MFVPQSCLNSVPLSRCAGAEKLLPLAFVRIKQLIFSKEANSQSSQLDELDKPEEESKSQKTRKQDLCRMEKLSGGQWNRLQTAFSKFDSVVKDVKLRAR